jgi:hypothetical protein
LATRERADARPTRTVRRSCSLAVASRHNQGTSCSISKIFNCVQIMQMYENTIAIILSLITGYRGVAAVAARSFTSVWEGRRKQSRSFCLVPLVRLWRLKPYSHNRANRKLKAERRLEFSPRNTAMIITSSVYFERTYTSPVARSPSLPILLGHPHRIYAWHE